MREQIQIQLDTAAEGVKKSVADLQTATGVKDKVAQFWIDKILAMFSAKKKENPQRSSEDIANELHDWLHDQPGNKMNSLLDIAGELFSTIKVRSLIYDQAWIQHKTHQLKFCILFSSVSWSMSGTCYILPGVMPSEISLLSGSSQQTLMVWKSLPFSLPIWCNTAMHLSANTSRLSCRPCHSMSMILLCQHSLLLLKVWLSSVHSYGCLRSKTCPNIWYGESYCDCWKQTTKRCHFIEWSWDSHWQCPWRFRWCWSCQDNHEDQTASSSSSDWGYSTLWTSSSLLNRGIWVL